MAGSDGLAWRDVPERYGPWETVYPVFRRRQIDGTWPSISKTPQVKADAEHAVGARKEG
ncbi:transposase [Streptomyces sp. NPDC049541]|uniref:transposase n=1 Tax=Streptomyces sp. NPDC049541 TaxID=3365594 RepID=UPI0037B6F0B9